MDSLFAARGCRKHAGAAGLQRATANLQHLQAGSVTSPVSKWRVLSTARAVRGMQACTPHAATLGGSMMCRTVCSACAAGVIRLSYLGRLLAWYQPTTTRQCIVLAGSTKALDILTSCLPKTDIDDGE